MPEPLARSRPTLVVVRSAALGVAVTISIACAEPSPTGPSRGAVHPPEAVLAASNGQGPQACLPDAKLIGRFAASTADVPGTWWRLTKDRFDDQGVTDYKAALEGFYGQHFGTLADAIQFLIDGVVAWDANGNGYVCAFEVRGTRAALGGNAAFLIGIADDKHFQD